MQFRAIQIRTIFIYPSDRGKINKGETKEKKEKRKKIFDEKVKPNAKCN